MEVAQKSEERHPVCGIICGIRGCLEEKNGAEGLNPLDNCHKR